MALLWSNLHAHDLPTAHTQSAGPISSTGATLNGMGWPNGHASTAWFEWGLVGGFDQSTAPVEIGGGTAVVRVRTEITGLLAGKSYSCRLVVSNALGVARAFEHRFTTGWKVTSWGDLQLSTPTGLTNVITVSAPGRGLAVTSDGLVAEWLPMSVCGFPVPSGLSNVVSLATGEAHAVALRVDGTLTAWGCNEGRLEFPPGLGHVVSIAANSWHSLALLEDGNVVEWSHGAMGETVPAGLLSNVVAIAAGGFHSVALLADHRVVAWGNGPINVPSDLTNAVAIAAGQDHNLAITMNGTVRAWGSNQYGQSTVPTGLSNVVAISAADNFSLALRSDGTLAAWGPPNDGRIARIPPNLTNVVLISAGRLHCLAIGNVPPVALTDRIDGPANSDLAFSLQTLDANGEEYLQHRIVSLPTRGHLFQYTAAGRGRSITNRDTIIEDPSGRLIFAPLPDEFGEAYASLSFVANDGEADSAEGVLTIDIRGRLFACTQPAWITSSNAALLNGMVLPNGFPTIAWFEWGQDQSLGNRTTPVNAGTDGNVVRLTEQLFGLTGGGRFQCRLVASNKLGVVHGSIQVFTTGSRVLGWGSNERGQCALQIQVKDATAVAAGSLHSLALRANGLVEAWGYDEGGVTRVPSWATNIVQITATGDRSCVLKVDGTVGEWGYYNSSFVYPSFSNVISVARGTETVLALTAQGRVVSPDRVPDGLRNIVAIAGAGHRFLALGAEGNVSCWENYGAIRRFPNNLSNIVAIATGPTHSLALKTDGTVVTWGIDSFGLTNIPPGLNDVVAVACGGTHSMALRLTGELVAWGGNSDGQSVVPTTLTNVTAMSAGGRHNLAVGNNCAPTVAAQSFTGYGNTDVMLRLSGTDPNGDKLGYRIISLPNRGTLYQYETGGRGAAIVGENTAVADPDGRVLFVPELNQAGDPYSSFTFAATDGDLDSEPGVAEIGIQQSFSATQAATGISTSGATLNGMVVPNGFVCTAWFDFGPMGSYNQATRPVLVGDGTTIVQVRAEVTNLAPGRVFSCRLVVSNAAGLTLGFERRFVTGGRLTAWGRSDAQPPMGLTNVVAISGGLNHTLAVTTEGAVVAWGQNSSGAHDLPPGVGPVVSVAAGYFHSLALRPNGTVVAWGDSSNGRTSVPASLTNVVAIAAGSSHSLALKANGTVVEWGDLPSIRVPSGLSNVVAIAAGSGFCAALKADGTVTVWGLDLTGQLKPPGGLKDVVAVSCHGEGAVALKADHTVHAWGYIGSPPPGLTNAVDIATGAGSTHFALALNQDGTVSAWGNGIYDFGQTHVPSGLSRVAALGAAWGISFALGANSPPVVGSQTVTGAANEGLAITLSGLDFHRDPLRFRIVSLPGAGSLYQYSDNGRGEIISTPETWVADRSNRVVFVPNPDAFARPYTQFDYVANDGRLDSERATITVHIIGHTAAATQPPAPILRNSATLNGMAVPGDLPAVAWFEWGSTIAYGESTEAFALPPGRAVVRVSAKLTGLAERERYFCRLVVTNAGGIAYGGPQVFTTGQKVTPWGTLSSGRPVVLPVGLSNVIAIAAGPTHSLALDSNRKLHGWGDGAFSEVPSLVNLPLAVAASGYHSLALNDDGTVTAWGLNDNGQTNVPFGLRNVIAIAAGPSHSLALRSDGTVVSWGAQSLTNVPPAATNIVAISSGYDHSLALTAAGTLVQWPDTWRGSPPSDLTDVIAIADGLALEREGRVVSWGTAADWPTNVLSGVSNVVAIASSGAHALALTATGKVVAWAKNTGKHTEVPDTLAIAAGIAAGGHSLALANVAPEATSQTNNGAANHDLIITLRGNDSNRDPLSYYIVSLPTVGRLFQYSASGRGESILSTNVQVQDASGRIIFVPEPDAFGNPYATFSFCAADDEGLRSEPATITVGLVTEPYVATRSAQPVRRTSATLNGMVLPNAFPSSAWFEWGPTLQLGNTTERVEVGSGNDLRTVAARLDNLVSNTVYSFRLVVSNNAGLTCGAQRQFTTGSKVAVWGTNAVLQQGLGDVTAIAVGTAHSLALKPDGTVDEWGRGFYYPARWSNVVAISASRSNSVALKDDGTVVAWGSGPDGINRVPPGLSNVMAVACGGYHNLALKVDGTVIAWNENNSAQMDFPPEMTHVVDIAAGSYSVTLTIDGTMQVWGNPPGTFAAPKGERFVAIAGGGFSALALTSRGQVTDVLASWWSRVPDHATNILTMSASGGGGLAVRRDGTVLAWGDNSSGQTTVPSTLTNVVAVASGEFQQMALHGNSGPSAAVRTNVVLANQDAVIALAGSDPDYDVLTFYISKLPNSGSLYQFTSGGRGPLIDTAGTAVTDPLGRILFAPGQDEFGTPYDHFEFLASDGQAESLPATMTISIPGTTYAFTQRPGLVSTTAANVHAMVYGSGLSVVSWFEWSDGSSNTLLTEPVTVRPGGLVKRVTAVLTNLSPGSIYSYRVVASNATGVIYGAKQRFRTGGKVTLWGYYGFNRTNVPAGLGEVISVAAGENHSMALRSDGTVAMWGEGFGYDPATKAPADLSNVVAIAGGIIHSMALLSDGSVRGWPHTRGGMIPILTNVPPGLTNAVSIACGRYHTVASTADGRVFAWGYDTDLRIPPGLSNVVAVAAGLKTSIALKIDGTITIWGYYAPGNPSLTNVVSVAGGTSHSVALLHDGNVVSWGSNYDGQTNVPPGLQDVVAVSAAFSQNFAIRADGSVVAWGRNTSGVTNVPDGLTGVTEVASGFSHAVALGGNMPPYAKPVQTSGYPNHDLVVTLSGGDPNGDLVQFNILSRPQRGGLYQFETDSRGGLIDLFPAIVTDPGGRVVFAPPLNEIGDSSFSYDVYDSETHSLPTSVTLNLVLPPAPALDPANCALNPDGSFIGQFTGHSNATYSVYTSTNLVDWEHLGFGSSITPGRFEFLDTANTNSLQRFYRVAAP